MSDSSGFWQQTILGNPVQDWAVALVLFLITFTLLPALRGFVRAHRRRLSTAGRLPVMFELVAVLIERTGRTFMFGLALWVASRDLTFPPRLERGLTVAIVLLLWIQVAQWATRAVRFALERRAQQAGGADSLLKSSMEVVLFAAGLVIWGIAALLALENLGVEIQPLLAGLGIGGIAVALAVQTVLADLLASLSIALDRPFAVGDALSIDDFQGTVEHIGVKSTRLRSQSGEQIVFANGDLLKSRVRNFGRMQERRALFTLDVHYETPVAALAAVPRAVREVVEATPGTRFDRCHLLRTTEKALQFEAAYYVVPPGFEAYADAQQSILLRILERLRALEIDFAAVAPRAVRVHPHPGASADASGQQRLL